MLKNVSKLEWKVGEKLYHLICDSDSPLEHVKESLFQFLKYIGQVEDAIKANQEAEKEKELEKPVEDTAAPEVTEETKQE